MRVRASLETMPRMSFDSSVPPYMQRYRVLMAKAKRRHKKRHGVNREKSENARRKNGKAAFKVAMREKRLKLHKEAARAYWSGEVECLRLG